MSRSCVVLSVIYTPVASWLTCSLWAISLSNLAAHVESVRLLDFAVLGSGRVVAEATACMIKRGAAQVGKSIDRNGHIADGAEVNRYAERCGGRVDVFDNQENKFELA